MKLPQPVEINTLVAKNFVIIPYVLVSSTFKMSHSLRAICRYGKQIKKNSLAQRIVGTNQNLRLCFADYPLLLLLIYTKYRQNIPLLKPEY